MSWNWRRSQSDKPLARWSSSFGHLPPSHHFLFRISKRLSSCSLRMARSNSSRYTDPGGQRGVKKYLKIYWQAHFVKWSFHDFFRFAVVNVLLHSKNLNLKENNISKARLKGCSTGHTAVCGVEDHPLKSGYIYHPNIKGIEINLVYFKLCF